MSIHPKSLANLRASGRPPLFTEEQALRILRERIAAGAGTNLRDFIKFESEPGGCIPGKASYPTITNLVKGRLFPDLIDPETGAKFDYSKVPSTPPGRFSRFGEDGVDAQTGERRRGIPPLRQWMMDRLMERVDETLAAKISARFKTLAHVLDQDNAARNARIEALEAKVAHLTKLQELNEKAR